MTLCITYKQGKGNAVSISDSLLTTIAPKKTGALAEKSNLDEVDNEVGAFLPSNVEIVHQTPHAVKVHIISQKEHFYSEDGYNFVCSIAGNVSLGLQCLLHLESYLQGTYNIWFDGMKDVILDKIRPFWLMARDREIELSFCIADHKRKMHIFEIKSNGDKLCLDEVDDQNGVLVSVIGDGAEVVKSDILKKINVLMMQSTISLDDAVHMCCIEALNDKVNDDDALFIGGSIQGAFLNCYSASYLAFQSPELFFRGAAVENSDKLDYPCVDLLSQGFPIKDSHW